MSLIISVRLYIFAALQKLLSGVVIMVVRGLALFFFTVLISQNIHAGTRGVSNYRSDPGANSNHVFGVYNANAYQEPDFESAAKLSSPLALPEYATYDVLVVINLSESVDAPTQLKIKKQKMRVYAREDVLKNIGYGQFENTNYDSESGLLFYNHISSGSSGHGTPTGRFRPQLFSSRHHSSIYGGASMPWAMFFNGNIATHGTPHLTNLITNGFGSHGCVRMEAQRAEDLFQLVGLVGKGEVAAMDKNKKFILDAYGEQILETNYKTLISVIK